LRPSLRPVLNATGVIVHTNLGRAPLADAARAAVAAAAAGYGNLELDLGTGERTSRHDHVAGLLCELTGAAAAAVVNNCAAAVLLAVSALAGRGREVVVSRGQLIEIGGGFRMPEVIEQAGAPPVRRSVRAGAAVVAFSGDKLLGGPQAGILVGTQEAVAAGRRKALLRAVR